MNQMFNLLKNPGDFITRPTEADLCLMYIALSCRINLQWQHTAAEKTDPVNKYFIDPLFGKISIKLGNGFGSHSEGHKIMALEDLTVIFEKAGLLNLKGVLIENFGMWRLSDKDTTVVRGDATFTSSNGAIEADYRLTIKGNDIGYKLKQIAAIIHKEVGTSMGIDAL